MPKALHILALLLLMSIPAVAQQEEFPDLAESVDDVVTDIDSLDVLPAFNTGNAWLYVRRQLGDEDLWKPGQDSLRLALSRLLDHVRLPYDSARETLVEQNFAEIPVGRGMPELVDSLELKWLNDSMFVVDPQGWNEELYTRQEMELVYPVDFSTLSLSDSSLLDENGMLDSTLFIPDTLYSTSIDTAALAALEITLHYLREGKPDPPLPLPRGKGSARLSSDSKRVEYFVPGDTWMADRASPFYILQNEYQLDSLQAAVDELLRFSEERDSIRILINDHYGQKTPMWISSGSDDSWRFWVKNYNQDSITLWIGNPESGEISLLLEDDVSFSRMKKEEIQHLPSFIREPERKLYEMEMLKPIPVYWEYDYSAALSMSQTYLSKSWTKGGESSFSTMIDMTGKATYNNKDARTQWINTARLKFGTLWTESKDGLRKNHDQFEIESRYNANAWGKIGLSASFYMKNQLAPGRKYYEDDSVVTVSKFLNPGTLTLGLGAEYKPFNKTTINMAPVSYKTTFVFDTVNIDQTIHGIAADKWARRELGFQLVINNEVSPFKGMTMKNQARFFSNYLNKPQNIDVDWELILEQKINWFFTIRLDLHLIYDDDTRTTVYDGDGNPVLNPDGTEKKSPQIQFKEFVGLALNFKF